MLQQEAQQDQTRVHWESLRQAVQHEFREFLPQAVRNDVAKSALRVPATSGASECTASVCTKSTLKVSRSFASLQQAVQPESSTKKSTTSLRNQECTARWCNQVLPREFRSKRCNRELL